MNQRIENRRESILEGAVTFFAQNGYRNTDIQEIANHLEIGKGTVYRYFPTKEALFLACCDKALNKMEEYVHLAIVSQKDLILRLTSAIQSYIVFFKNHPEFVELFVQERAEFKTRKLPTYLSHRAKRNSDWQELFTELYKQGKIRQSNPDIIIDCIINLLYGIMFTQIFQEDEKVFEMHAKSGLEMVLYGLLIPDSSSKSDLL